MRPREALIIRFKKGDILFEDAEALVNTVNCVGIMGRGIALQFRKAFPENFHTYAEACKRGEVRPGRMFVHATRALTNPRYIVNFPTKRHWRGDSRIEDIEAGLRDLARVIREYDIRSIAVPPLGSGLGGLDWPIVRARIEEALGSLNDVGIVVFEPVGAPAAGGMVRHDEAPTMTEGQAALVGLMDRYLNGLLEPFITLLEVHKLLYFMQIAGQPLNLRFRAGPYGPYAENLRHVLNKVEGHFISGYADGGDAPDKQLQLVPGAIDAASGVLRSACETRERFDRSPVLSPVSNRPLASSFSRPFIGFSNEKPQHRWMRSSRQRTLGMTARGSFRDGRSNWLRMCYVRRDGLRPLLRLLFNDHRRGGAGLIVVDSLGSTWPTQASNLQRLRRSNAVRGMA